MLNVELYILFFILGFWLGKTHRRGRPRPYRIAFKLNGEKVGIFMASFKVDKNVSGTITAVDKFGNNAGSFDAPPSWAIDSAFASIAVSEDGLSATITPIGILGTTSVNANGLSGGNPVSGSAEISFLAGDVTALTVSLAQA